MWEVLLSDAAAYVCRMGLFVAYLGAALTLAAFLSRARDRLLVVVMAVGAAMNIAAVLANGGMPVAGFPAATGGGWWVHIPIHEGTRLLALCDVLFLGVHTFSHRDRFVVLSLGDHLIVLSCIVMAGRRVCRALGGRHGYRVW